MAGLTEDQKRRRDQMIDEIRGQYDGLRQDVYREVDDYYDQRVQLEEIDRSESREIGWVYDQFDPPRCDLCGHELFQDGGCTNAECRNF